MRTPLFRFAHPNFRAALFVSLLLACACSPATPTAEVETLYVQYTFAAQPWLADLSQCAGSLVIAPELRAADALDPKSVELVMRNNENFQSTLPAFQIGTEDILVIVNPQNTAGKLTSEEVQSLFSGHTTNWQEIGGSDSPVQVWVFAPGEDIQQIFTQALLSEAPVTSLAHLASSPEEMTQAIAADAGAIGLLTRHWKAGNVSEAYTVATVPVLAITPSEPQGALADALACLQK